MSKQNPLIVLTGAGSGGHITPILAVADSIKKANPGANLVYIGQKGDSLGDIPARHPSISKVYAVRAGKFRRYHGEGIKQLLDVPTFLKNCRDAFYVLAGLYQSRRLLKRLKPDVVFVKGGFVGVPVGLAAAWLHIPYVTHDSDAIPGLANRIISRWAELHAVAMPKDLYEYPQAKTITTGIPLQKDFELVSPELKARYRNELSIPDSAKVLFVIGGGLGSQRINGAVIDAVPALISEFDNLYVLHAVGRANSDAVKEQYGARLPEAKASQLQVHGYLDDVYKYSGAADLIITRAGATNLAEFAVQGRACIVVPSPFLAGGHQLKNAEVLEAKQAIVALPENKLLEDSDLLLSKVRELLNDDSARDSLASNFRKLAMPDGAEHIAEILLGMTREVQDEA